MPLHGGLKSGWNEAEPKAGVHWIIPRWMQDGAGVHGIIRADSESQESPPIRLEADGIRLMQSWVEAIKERISKAPEEERPVCLWFIGEVELHAETARRLEPGFGERRIFIRTRSKAAGWGTWARRGRSPVKRMMCIRWYPIIHSFPKRKRTSLRKR